MGSRRGWRAAGLGLTVGWLGAALSSAAARTDVPVLQSTMPDGTVRYSVPVSIGNGPPIAAELDTGSFGLRILAAAAAPDNYAATSLRRTYAFTGGEKFEGFLARATVGIGPSRTIDPLYVMVIDHVSCVEQKPHCYASRVKPDDYGIAGGGVANQGFKAILGISLRRVATDESAVNPLTQMGSGSWILSLPRPDGTETGHLIIDPDPSDRAGFAPLQLKSETEGRLAGWSDAALPGCLAGDDGRPPLCGDTLLDSGDPGFSVATTEVSEPKPYGADKSVTFEIGGAEGPVSVPFITGHDITSRVVLHPPRRGTATRISAGTLPFFSYDVLYNSRSGVIGFRKRDPLTR